MQGAASSEPAPRYDTGNDNRKESLYNYSISFIHMITKAEKREEKKRKSRSHKVSGKSVISLAKLIEDKSEKARKKTI
jgi:hypothetical protein